MTAQIDLFWPASAFLSDEAGFPGPIDVTGAPRILSFGPYAWLSAGCWRARVAFELCAEAANYDYGVEFGIDGDFSETSVRADRPGPQIVEVTHCFSRPAQAEIRLRVCRAAFHGAIRLIGVEMTPLSEDGQAGPPAAVRTLPLGARQVQICGTAGDPYFENAAFDGPNDFLGWICTNWLKPDATVLDVGANVGVTAALLAHATPQGAIYCFEPSPSVFPCLLKTLELNALATCRGFPLALGAEEGRLGFFDNPTSASASHLHAEERSLGGASHVVDVSTVDAFVREQRLSRLDLIKIDVEGFEADVLAGAAQTLAGLAPSVFLEINSFTLIAYGDRHPRRFMEELLATFPFVYRFSGGAPRRIESPGDLLDFIHDNLVHHRCVDDVFCTRVSL